MYSLKLDWHSHTYKVSLCAKRGFFYISDTQKTLNERTVEKWLGKVVDNSVPSTQKAEAGEL